MSRLERIRTFGRLPWAAAWLVGPMVCGCGGGGSSSSTVKPAVFAYAGTYVASGTVSNSSDAVTCNIGVGADGTLCGTLNDSITKTQFTLGGVVSDAGVLSKGTIQYFDAKGNSQGFGALSGQVTGIGAGTNNSSIVSVVLTATNGSETIHYNFTMGRTHKRKKGSKSIASAANG